MTQAVSRHHYTLADYLEVEELSGVRHELIGGEIVAMAGGTPEHAALSAALPVIIGPQLAGRRCRVYSSDLRIRVGATGLATYADGSVVCDPVERDPSSPTHVTNPTVVFEVLSPATADYDRGEKREHYLRIDSLREYVLVAQDRRSVELWSRADLTSPWQRSEHGDGDTVELRSFGCRLPVSELYATAGL